MEDNDSLFKKFFYTGVGLTISTKEKLEKKIKELVDKNKITEQEGKKIIDEFITDFDQKKDELEKEFKNFIKKTTDSMKLAKKKDVDTLNTRLDEIESKIESFGSNSPKEK